MTLKVKHFQKIAIIAIFDTTSVVAEELLSHDKSKLVKKVIEWGKIASNNGADSCYVRLYDANKETIDIILENLPYKELPIILPFSLNHESSLVSAFHFRDNDKIKTHQTKNRNVLFGKSCHSLKSIKEAEQCGIDDVFFSPIFKTQTHPEAKGIGLSMLRKACESTQIKVFALGGINENNYRQCLDVGAFGVAAISMFTKSSPLNANK
ncbi:thiamine phosphate synthase [Nostoc sp.]|uniref:thiamine phosphate synthase n=1 Tax=Nostoc sp. TaxID=1180 RepID=UPI002FFD3848